MNTLYVQWVQQNEKIIMKSETLVDQVTTDILKMMDTDNKHVSINTDEISISVHKLKSDGLANKILSASLANVSLPSQARATGSQPSVGIKVG